MLSEAKHVIIDEKGVPKTKSEGDPPSPPLPENRQNEEVIRSDGPYHTQHERSCRVLIAPRMTWQLPQARRLPSPHRNRESQKKVKT